MNYARRMAATYAVRTGGEDVDVRGRWNPTNHYQQYVSGAASNSGSGGNGQYERKQPPQNNGKDNMKLQRKSPSWRRNIRGRKLETLAEEPRQEEPSLMDVEAESSLQEV